ncbi:hypothetical protein T484DRAFT_1794456 [Baffinella frigidus]|nr:hypothetical protein T484DRAFT_1794456 [Cryptophyta sp. CCMP2293]
MAVLLLGLGLFALALPACIALPAQGSEAGDGPAMRLRGAGDEAAGGGAPRFFNPETMRVTTEDETLTMGNDLPWYAAVIPQRPDSYSAADDEYAAFIPQRPDSYAAFIPQRPDSYSAADDESLPLAHRLNAGLALPNIYTPKEYTPKEYTHKEYTPKEYTPKEYTPKEYTPKEYTHKEYTPKEYTPKEYTPKEYTPKEYTPKEYTHKECTHKEYNPKEGLALPNIYAPKEYAPLRALLGGFADSPLVRTILGTREEPEQEEDSNGNLLSAIA